MPTVQISANQLGEALLREAQHVPRALPIAALAAARRFQGLLVRRTDEAGVTDTGALKNSWRAERTEDGAEVISDCPYAGIVELGARPHAVSVEGQQAIRQWCIRKLGLTEEEADRATFLICRKIREHGQEGHHIVENALPMAVAFLGEELRRVLDQRAGGAE